MTRATLCLALLVAFLLATACAEPVPYGYLLPSDPELRAQAEALADLHKQLPEAKTPADWVLLQAQIEDLQAMYGDVMALVAYYGNTEVPQEEVDAAYTSVEALRKLLLQGGQQDEGKQKPYIYPVSARSLLARLCFLTEDWHGLLEATAPLLGPEWGPWASYFAWPASTPWLLTDLALRKLGKPGLAGAGGNPSPAMVDHFAEEAHCLQWAKLQLVAGDVELLKLAEERLGWAAERLGSDFKVLSWYKPRASELDGFDLRTPEGRRAANEKLGYPEKGTQVDYLSTPTLEEAALEAQAIRGLVNGQPAECVPYVQLLEGERDAQFARSMSPVFHCSEDSLQEWYRQPAATATLNYFDARRALAAAGLAQPLLCLGNQPVCAAIARDGFIYAPVEATLILGASARLISGWEQGPVELKVMRLAPPEQGSDKTESTRTPNTKVLLTVGSIQAEVAGKPVTLSAPVLREGGRLLVAAQDFMPLFGLDWAWFPDEQRLELFPVEYRKYVPGLEEDKQPSVATTARPSRKAPTGYQGVTVEPVTLPQVSPVDTMLPEALAAAPSRDRPALRAPDYPVAPEARQAAGELGNEVRYALLRSDWQRVRQQAEVLLASYGDVPWLEPWHSTRTPPPQDLADAFYASPTSFYELQPQLTTGRPDTTRWYTPRYASSALLSSLLILEDWPAQEQLLLALGKRYGELLPTHLLLLRIATDRLGRPWATRKQLTLDEATILVLGAQGLGARFGSGTYPASTLQAALVLLAQVEGQFGPDFGAVTIEGERPALAEGLELWREADWRTYMQRSNEALRAAYQADDDEAREGFKRSMVLWQSLQEVKAYVLGALALKTGDLPGLDAFTAILEDQMEETLRSIALLNLGQPQSPHVDYMMPPTSMQGYSEARKVLLKAGRAAPILAFHMAGGAMCRLREREGHLYVPLLVAAGLDTPGPGHFAYDPRSGEMQFSNEFAWFSAKVGDNTGLLSIADPKYGLLIGGPFRDESFDLPAPVLVEDGDVLIPVELLETLFNKSLAWDESHQVYVYNELPRPQKPVEILPKKSSGMP